MAKSLALFAQSHSSELTGTKQSVLGIPVGLAASGSGRMRDGITFSVSQADRQRLSDIAAAPLSPHKHVWRARIVLLSSNGLGTWAIMAATGKLKTCVWRW